MFPKIKISILFIFIFSLAVSQDQFKRKQKVDLEINFEHYVHDLNLKLDSSVYKNSLGQDFTISKFNYYISNIKLVQKNGKEYFSKEYFLIKEEDSTSKKIHLKNIPSGEYTSIEITIGIDSLKNCSGVQSGALDPIHGMFWTWNTGYIFLKLEGTSSFSNLPNNLIEYHIGGFRQENNCIRKINLPLNESLIISKNESSKITITADILEILSSQKEIDFSILPAVTGQANSQTICNNYVNAFKIKPISK
jgi:hypothetical protein